MKKFIYTLLLLVAVMASSNAQAQSLDDLLKGLASLVGVTTESTEQKPKITHPEIYELIGRWNFDGLVMDYTGDSSIAAVAVSTLEGSCRSWPASLTWW